MEQQINKQYFNDAQLYMLNMDCRDEVVVAGRGLGKGAIQARRLQSCFQGKAVSHQYLSFNAHSS